MSKANPTEPTDRKQATLHEDGGPAFPAEIDDVFVNEAHPEIAPFKLKRHVRGMSLRDYFAARAMHAELNTSGWNHDAAVALVEGAALAGRTIPEHIAANSYEMADAMIARRKLGAK